MPFCTHDYVNIRSFSGAKKAFDDIPAIRGRNKDLYGVPLQKNRRAHGTKTLVKHVSPSGDVSFRCYLYSTAVVVYLNNGNIVLDLSYRSESTCGFASALTPSGVSVYLSNKDAVVSCAAGEFIVDGEITLAPLGTNGYTPVNPKQRYVDRLNRSRAAQARKVARPLMEYLKTIAGVCPLTDSTVRAMRENHSCSLDPLNPEDFPAIAASMIFISTHEGLLMRPDWKEHTYQQLYRRFDCYDSVPVPFGQIKKNSYTKP